MRFVTIKKLQDNGKKGFVIYDNYLNCFFTYYCI